MKKLIAILSVVLFANQASADAEYLCNAWSSPYSNKKPFILKKADKVITFENYFGIPQTATYAGLYDENYSVYIRKSDNSFITIFYFNDHDTAEERLDDTLVQGSALDIRHNAAKCYRN